VGAQKKF